MTTTTLRIALTIPPTDTHAVAWWRAHALAVLKAHAVTMGRVIHGRPVLSIISGRPSMIVATARETRPTPTIEAELARLAHRRATHAARPSRARG